MPSVLEETGAEEVRVTEVDSTVIGAVDVLAGAAAEEETEDLASEVVEAATCLFAAEFNALEAASLITQ